MINWRGEVSLLDLNDFLLNNKKYSHYDKDIVMEGLIDFLKSQNNEGVKMENDINKKRYNELMGEKEPQEPIRTDLVMSLVFLFFDIKNLEKDYDFSVLSRDFDMVLKKSNLNTKELSLFYFEVNDNGV